MVVEIFQEILSSLSLAAIFVCLVTTVIVLVPCSNEVVRKGISNSTADSVVKEELYEGKHRGFGVIRDLGKGRMTEFSGFEALIKVDVHEEEEIKGANLETGNAAGDDKEVFPEELKGERMGVGGIQDVRGVVVDECSARPKLSSQIKEQLSPDAKTPLRYNSGDEGAVSEAKWDEVSEILESDKLNTEKASHDEEEEGAFFDDWEGIERTELETLFGRAVAFIGTKSNADRLDSSVRLQLYALHKVAIEGPCHQPRPMALKLFARAKWNAWQRLGDMNRDMAMEQYMILLSKIMPKWEGR